MTRCLAGYKLSTLWEAVGVHSVHSVQLGCSRGEFGAVGVNSVQLG